MRSLTSASCASDSVMPWARAPYFSRGVAEEPAPAAADVEKAVALAQAQLAADHVELVDLRLFQGVAPVGEVSAGILHLRIKEQFVEVIAHVVVELDEILVLFLLATGADLVARVVAAALRLLHRGEHERPQRLEDIQLADLLEALACSRRPKAARRDQSACRPPGRCGRGRSGGSSGQASASAGCEEMTPGLDMAMASGPGFGPSGVSEPSHRRTEALI